MPVQIWVWLWVTNGQDRDWLTVWIDEWATAAAIAAAVAIECVERRQHFVAERVRTYRNVLRIVNVDGGGGIVVVVVVVVGQ